MTLHQALDRARLVAAVVVDVHLGVGVEPVDHEPDEPLEGGLLRLLGGRPDVDVARLPVDLLDDAEEVLEADLGRPRIGLDIEEEVPWRRFRQGAEAASGVGRIGRDQLEDVFARDALLELESRLFADPRQLRARDALDRAVRLEDGELASVGTPAAVSRSVSSRRIPATIERWSSSRRRWMHIGYHVQTRQWSTGSG